jgi:hypothetical protein
VGNRIVDISIAHFTKNLAAANEVFHGSRLYRLTLSEAHDFLPLAICAIYPVGAGREALSTLDGRVVEVVLYENYSNVNGIPVPSHVTIFDTIDEGSQNYVRYRAESVKLNEQASVRDHLDIPVGALVANEIREITYFQGEKQTALIDQAATEAVKEIERKKGEFAAVDSKSKTSSPDLAARPIGSLTSAICIGAVLGLLALAGVWFAKGRRG